MAFSGAIEDRVAIRELLDTYADAVNQRDAEAWGGCWAEDSFWSLPGFGEFQGRQQIVETWKGAMEHFPNVVFLATTGAITIAGDRATIRSYTAESYTDAEGRPHHDCGQYDDELVKRGGEWKFQKRTFRSLHRA